MVSTYFRFFFHLIDQLSKYCATGIRIEFIRISLAELFHQVPLSLITSSEQWLESLFDLRTRVLRRTEREKWMSSLFLGISYFVE